MHRRVSTILHRLRQDLAATLGTDFIQAACLAAGHTWSDAALLTPAAIIYSLAARENPIIREEA